MIPMADTKLTCPRCDGPLYDPTSGEPEPEGAGCFMIDEDHYDCTSCTCSRSDTFSCDEFPRIVPTPNATPRQRADSKRPCEERRKTMRESSINASVNSRQYLEWVADAARISRQVAEGNTDLGPVFWIRLYGILYDVYGYLDKQTRFLTSIGFKNLPQTVVFVKSIEDLAALFSADEQIYIQYRRDTECHPVQKAYEFSIGQNGHILDQYFLKMLGKKTQVAKDDMRATALRVIKAAKHETQLAPLFAQRCWRQLAELEVKAAPLWTPTR